MSTSTKKPKNVEKAAEKASWTFLTNHAHVLLCLAQTPDARIRDLAVDVGITERAVQNILADLQAEGIITAVREGRRNRYTIHGRKPLRHPVEAHRKVRDLINLV
ncbi:MAG: winged helix-turn-helix domain-containing protein [Planctomycetota bacterium]